MPFNCQFKIFRDYDKIFFFNEYAQEIFYQETQGYDSFYYKFEIKIIDEDESIKMCLLYVVGYESKDFDYETEILVPDNIRQKMNFDNDFNNIRFLYPPSNPEKDLAIVINNIDLI